MTLTDCRMCFNYIQQVELKTKVGESQITLNAQTQALLRTQLQEKSRSLDELTFSNAELSEQCKSLFDQLEVAHERHEKQKTEWAAWEAALKQASSDQKKQFKIKRGEKRELEELIEAKDAQIADLQLEVRAKEALLDAYKNGMDLNQSSVLYDSNNNSRDYILAHSSQPKLDNESYGSKAAFY